MGALLRQGSFICLAVALLTPLAAFATTSASLAADPYWQRLLRDPSPDDGRYASNVTLPGFFLAADGARDAEAELRATLIALAAPDTTGRDDHAACRFPARRQWLAQKLPDQSAHWPRPACPAVSAWLQGLDVAQATLVFASDYLNNPSSMFGHTLLRLDASTQTDDTRLLAYAINYSAQTNTSNGLEFAYKGLTGGYPGAFSLLPYYEKVKEYNDWESRDLWEYELNLSRDEVRTLVLTYRDWEGVTSPYYFLSRNCSYELLGLLEMARPGLRLQARFPVAAIPSDTLRAVLEQPGLLKRVTWRAASGTRQAATMARNDHATNRAALALMTEPEKTLLALTSMQQARALELAHDDLYVRHVNREAHADSPVKLRQLLQRRSRMDVPDQRVAPERPAVDPAHGHDTARWSLGTGHDHENSLRIGLRPAYHDWLDPSPGYRAGARVDFLDLNLRAGPSGLGVHSASVVAIDSLAPLNPLRTPLSWSVRLGVDQALSDRSGDPRNHTISVFEGGAGVAIQMAGQTCYGQSHSDLRGARALHKGWEIGSGARLGCNGSLSLSGLPEMRWLLEARSMYRWPDAAWGQELRSGLQFPLNPAQALRLELRREWRDESLTGISLNWLRYF